MSSILTVICRAGILFLMFILTMLILKTVEYFNRLPETDKNKPLLAWDTLALIASLISLAVKLLNS